MRAVVQRVSEARVKVDGRVVGEIGKGMLILLGVARGDTREDADYLAGKIAGLRIFGDAGGKMNLDVTEAGGCLLVVSQFTLYADTRKGRRPNYDQAADPVTARALYEYFVDRLRSRKLSVDTGVFQASMEVELVNAGPVTLICNSHNDTN